MLRMQILEETAESLDVCFGEHRANVEIARDER
jgi:hypothetical protein